MQSAYHNCPTINGVMQSAGRQYEATDVKYQATDAAAEFSLNLAKAYPAAAGLRTWNRVIRLDRAANRVEIADRYTLDKPAAEITLTLMTPIKPQPAPSRIEIPARCNITFDAAVLTPKIEEIGNLDPSLAGVWGKAVYRILLVAKNPPPEGRFQVTIQATA